MQKISQYRLISSKDDRNNWPGGDILSPGGKILSLGVQATPGTKISFNKKVKDDDNESYLMVGPSGIFTIDLSEKYIEVRSIHLKFINDDEGRYPTIIDIIYEDGGY